MRVESRQAIPALAGWLAEAHGVEFLRETRCARSSRRQIETTRGTVHGRGLRRLSRRRFPAPVPRAPRRLRPDPLQAAHAACCAARPDCPRFTAAVMSDLGLVRYLGYAELPEAAALRRRLEGEQPDASGQRRAPDRGAERGRLAGGRRLAPLRRDARSVRAGCGRRADPGRAAHGRGAGPIPRVLERWTGTYASADGPADARRPRPPTRCGSW